jgi:predicted negative regulator of RcsB-dependent stress response
MGDVHLRMGDTAAARSQYANAAALARNPKEKELLERKMTQIGDPS